MTPTLGDHFPTEYRESLCDRYVKPGAVFRLQFPYTNPPKIKRFVMIGINEKLARVGFLFINSQINPNIITTSHLQNLQFLMEAHDRPYIDHDSYLDCSRLYEDNFQRLKDNYVLDTKTYLGQLTEADLVRVKQLVISARTIEKRKKKRYGLLE